ncbi:hypothetical protein [Psychrobacter urativorans]|uniref:hypothetical protein n=1 Tax=Psychrobacter urativorans TaxID=45610 RepID=UPI00191B5D30|nr:hypothetical protein [Psychrobacter urativorans]
MTDKSTFVLKLSGIDLSDITAGDMARMLANFCKLLGSEELYLDSIYSGSAVAKVYTDRELYIPKLDKLNQSIAANHLALDEIQSVVRRYAKNFSGIDANILASRTASNDDELEQIYHIDYRKAAAHVFEQNETFVGKLLKPAHGKDETDHFTILLANENRVSVEMNKNLSFEIAPFLEALWRHESLIKFSGLAKYEHQDNYKIKLKCFNASSFKVIPNTMTAKLWMKEFVDMGESGWQKEEEPIKNWLKERHS